ncbi:MAG: NUDIX hydrolase, partial [Gammaproteobacteria bacterium]
VYDGSPYIKIFKDTVMLPNKKIINDYHRIEVNNAVMLLIENNQNQLLVYNEYRHGIADISYTFPAGGIESGESFKDASEREVMEELGYKFNNIKLLKKYVVSGSYMFSELNMVSIKNIKKVSVPKEVDIENPEIMWLSKELVKQALLNDKFRGLTYATAALIWLLYKDDE